MYGIKELAEILNLSDKQVRRRLSLILPYLDGHCRKGPRGKILVDERGKEILQRIISREHAGSSLLEAVRSVLLELQTNMDNHGRTLPPETSREHTGKFGKEKEALDDSLFSKSHLNEENTFPPNLPTGSSKMEIPTKAFWILVLLGIIIFLLQVVILLKLA